MFGEVAAELVWFVSPATEAYDVMLYRAMAAEYHLASAIVGRPWAGLWFSYRHLEQRWEPFERAALSLGVGRPSSPDDGGSASPLS